MRISSRLCDITGWFLFLFFVVATIVAIATSKFVLVVFFFPAAALGLFLILYHGSIEMNEVCLRYKTKSGTYEIRWDEMTQVEFGISGGIIFHGKGNKILSTSGPSHWPSTDSEEGFEFLLQQIKKHQILIIESEGRFRFPRNTKIKTEKPPTE